MFNEKIVGVITPFSGSTTSDKNGKLPVMIQVVAGKCVNRQVLSGTVAERAGLEVGKTYLIQVRATGEDIDFQTQFNFTKIVELTTGKDIVEASLLLGAPEILVIERSKDYSYDRKGDAVIGLSTLREQEGKFKPAVGGSRNHSNAKEVIKGSSTDNDFDSGKTWDNTLPGEETEEGQGKKVA